MLWKEESTNYELRIACIMIKKILVIKYNKIEADLIQRNEIL